MTARARRAIALTALAVLLLFLGRWCAAFFSERWWAATIGPEALDAVTRWHLLGLALDIFAVVLAALWFVVQALLVARTIASVDVARRLGEFRVREAVPVRVLVAGAIAMGTLLGLLTGAGAAAWRAPVALSWQTIRFGVTDPLLGLDIGRLLTEQPVRALALEFAATLAVVAFAFVLMLYALIGGIRREGTRIALHPDARRHLGLLLALLALVIAAGSLLRPWDFAMGSTAEQLGAAMRVTGANAVAGVAGATMVLSFLWALRGRHPLLVGGWSALLLAMLFERGLLPVMAEQAPTVRDDAATARRFDALAWRIAPESLPTGRDSLPTVSGVWDAATLPRLTGRSGPAPLAATPSGHLPGGGAPGWLIVLAGTGAIEGTELLGIPETTGAPGAAGAFPAPLLTVPEARVRPDAVPWRVVRRGGVVRGGWFRRLMLAWGQQAGGMLERGGPDEGVDWHLRPADRAAAVLPMFTWLDAEVVVVGGRPGWVVPGMLRYDAFPAATRAGWGTATIAGMVPAVLAVIDAASGAVAFYLDPAADPVAEGWSRFAPGLIRPALAIPPEVLGALVYPADWLATQAAVLETAAWGLGRRPGWRAAIPTPAPPVAVWGTGGRPAWQLVFEDSLRRGPTALIEGERVAGRPVLRLARFQGNEALQGRELARLWSRNALLGHRRDSVLAAGDSVVAGQVRWYRGPAGLAAWQAQFAIDRQGVPRLVAVGAALGDRVGAGKHPAEAWANVLGAEVPVGTPLQEEVVERARRWMLRADSALARGDLTAFGRAFESLRAVLLQAGPR